MRIFDIPGHMEKILQAIEDGREPDPEQVKALVEEGPTAIDLWCRAIMELEEKRDALDRRIKGLRERRDQSEKSAGEMRRKLHEILDSSFNGKVETHEFTVWVQSGVLRIRK